jgi:methylglutaconyl-CoA hydratase
MMNENFVEIDTSIPNVVILTLNRPEKRNALSIHLMRQFIEAINLHSKNCRSLVIAAKGTVFCAGLDLQEATDPKMVDICSKTIVELYTAIYLAPCVTLCAVQGDALAGGIGLMMAADFVLMAQNAAVSFPEVKIGIVPALVAVMLKRQISMRYVRELLIFGRKVGANKALAMGVVNEVVSVGDVLDETIACAQSVAQSSPDAIRALKKLFIELDPASLQVDFDKALKAKQSVLFF